MRQHVFNLAGNRATVTLYDPDCPDNWTVKLYKDGSFYDAADDLSENDAINIAQNTLNNWKGLENV